MPPVQTACLQVDSLTKRYGDLLLFENITFGIAQKQKTGLIAKNGAGKTTLMRIVAGKESADEGSVTFRNDLRVGYLEQSPRYPDELTVLEACFSSTNPVVRLIAEYESAVASEDAQRLEAIAGRMDGEKAWDYERKVKQILSQLKIDRFDAMMGTLSGGQAKRVALAHVLIGEPELVLLDEPTNHLDLEVIEWLETYLTQSGVSLLMVTHDRYFLDRICNEIIEIDNHSLYRYKGNYSYYLEKRDERLSAARANSERAHNLMRKELEWMRRQPQARGTKAKYRVDAFHELEAQARRKPDAGDVRLLMESAYIGSKIFEAVNVCKRFGDTHILDDFNYTFARYEKLGIVGHNGTGKSTFVRMLTGQIPPDSGHFDVGETVRFGYYSQDELAFDDNMKVIDAVQDIAEYVTLAQGKTLSVSQFLNHFLFTPDRQHHFIRKLSGGEKRRLYLCTVLMRNPNFLVLDEPTNDLDIATLNVLEEYLQSFKGCLIVVSHDRYFMDKVADHILVFHGDAHVQDFPGNYTQYREWKENAEREKKKEDAPAAKEPPRARTAKQERKKPSYRERIELESLETEIAALERESAQLTTTLSDNLPVDELSRRSQRIAEIIDTIARKTDRWIELSEYE
ncbi:MAG: ABC-F family ATP-binding cassette domain-containing protein [Tannerella sp.]|jgi:ATP-binding cassette subfamily F protein uup|nr:ABC-F family ATP-binding cassette domain-containing protein [Tannerella sp.]